MTKGPYLDGQLLIAMPGMSDPRFERSVIYMCAHSEQGAMGIIINKATPMMSFGELLSQLDLTGDEPLNPPAELMQMPVLFGGPVEQGRGFVLHTDDWLIDDASVAFAEGLAMTGTREALLAMVDPASGPNRSVLLLGYAGWGEGQLEDELGENVWLTADADPELIFDADYDGKWARALAGLGIDPAQLSGQSGRA